MSIKYPRSNEQKLVDIMFSIGLIIHDHEYFDGKSIPEVAEYIAEQLRENGFDTHQVGSSWGVLTNEKE